MDGEMFWFAGQKVYDKSWPEVITAETAAWRLRELHYSTLSIVHGFLDGHTDGLHENETIARWMRTPLDVTRLMLDRLPIAPAYAMAAHTGYEYVRDHLGYRIELQWADFPATVKRGVAFNFSAAVVNWGFAAPVNPRPVMLVVLDENATSLLWSSSGTLADVRDWQPHVPGDPTFAALEHVFQSEQVVPPGVQAGARLPIGLFLPDARMEKLADTAKMAAAFSVQLANEGMPWAVIKGHGAVNVIGHLAVV
jgi:hypothetical protein